MNLVIDRGNTRIKSAWFMDKNLIKLESFDKVGDLKSWASHLRSNNEPETQVLVSNTKGDQLDLGEGFKITNLSEVKNFPIGIDYETPQTLGADRIANSCAAASIFPDSPSLVIDAGTCITFDLIINGNFSGGAISPGIAMRMRAMHDYTGRLPLLPSPYTTPRHGKNTNDSMLSGGVHGAILEVEKRIEQYNSEFPGLQVLVTGGDISYFEKGLKCPIFADANLTLLGLNEILLFCSK